jgi:hypothetical protein
MHSTETNTEGLSNMEKLEVMGRQESHEDVSFEEGELPTMLFLIIGVVILAALVMAVVFFITGNTYITNLLGNSPQRT